MSQDKNVTEQPEAPIEETASPSARFRLELICTSYGNSSFNVVAVKDQEVRNLEVAQHLGMLLNRLLEAPAAFVGTSVEE